MGLRVGAAMLVGLRERRAPPGPRYSAAVPASAAPGLGR